MDKHADHPDSAKFTYIWLLRRRKRGGGGTKVLYQPQPHLNIPAFFALSHLWLCKHHPANHYTGSNHRSVLVLSTLDATQSSPSSFFHFYHQDFHIAYCLLFGYPIRQINAVTHRYLVAYSAAQRWLEKCSIPATIAPWNGIYSWSHYGLCNLLLFHSIQRTVTSIDTCTSLAVYSAILIP